MNPYFAYFLGHWAYGLLGLNIVYATYRVTKFFYVQKVKIK